MGGEATKEKIRRAIVIIYILMLPVASVFVALAGLCAHIPPHLPLPCTLLCANPLRETTGKLWCVGGEKGCAWTSFHRLFPQEYSAEKREKQMKTGPSYISCLLTEFSSGVSSNPLNSASIYFPLVFSK